MAKRIKGITIEIDGNTQKLNDALKDTDKQLSKTQSELRDVDRLLKLDPKNTELLEQKQRLLAKAADLSAGRLDTLKKAADQMGKELKDGAAATDAQKDSFDALNREIIATQQNMDKLQESSSSGDSGGGGMAFAGIGTAALVEGGKAVLGYVEETKELRRSLSFLDQAAQESGVGIDTARAAFEEFYALTKEEDSSIEAVSNLLQANFSGDNLQTVLEALGGAVVKFPDTLKVESLADSLQETIATGEATGQFAELLERLGIDIDTFNAKMAGATSTADRQNIVLQTLSAAGLTETYNGWKQNNAAMIENATTEIQLQESMSGLGETLDQVKAAGQGLILSFFDWFDQNQEWLLPLLIAIGTALLTWNVISMLQGLGAAIKSSTLATQGFNAALSTNPIGIVITAITTLIALFVALWNGSEDFRNFFIGMWEGIKNAVSSAWNFIVGLFAKGGEIFNGVVDGIANVFKTIVNGIISGINWVIAQPFNFINGILNGIRSIDILGFKPFEGLWGQNPLPVPQIPMLAKGGVLTAGSAIVGEAGAELLTVSGGRAIVQPLNGQNRAAGALASPTVNITINNGQFSRADALKVARMVNRELGAIY